ncbi:SET and MYND domain-containing protein 4 [Aethina tumida]|uniref:SET and MYND domain-containing protein 4 n=1 Tax=Aethina tumida TaxID=116153 RepID=UPI00096AF133|nr:SET and MYND domain-containing protein 4 [Aethina tumida]XP_019867310.1 SET and MYND domain-containing protein 4 [Aethina tumida]
MEQLLAHYTEKFTKIDGNIFEVFSQFYNLDLSEIENWLQAQFKNKTLKDDKLSTVYRQEGNKYYARKDRLKSLEFYTKSLCSATPNGKEYGLALANRSAVSFEMGEYENCVRDINLCFKTNYPTDLKPKIYIRKAECYIYLGQKENLEQCISEMYNFISSANIPGKEKYFSKIENFKKSKNLPTTHVPSETSHELPKLTDGENENFAYASAKLKMSYEKSKGRHVIARKNIQKGDVLFVEKALIFAPVFKENKELYPFKCYNCLKDTLSCIPCQSCTLCFYCNENCRVSSWNECHKWECQGMQTNFWHDLGIGFPGFKAMLKGIPSGFRNIKGDHEEDLKSFGSKEDNYPYFNRLVSNIYRSKNVVPYTVMSAVVVIYLKKYTDFFSYLLTVPNCPKQDMDSLIRYIGGLITKHTAQLSSNSMIVEHWTYSTSDMLFPDILITVACGMFPSVSIMNHSCRPNVTTFFICDTIVVKALEDISENEEIFNCYGIDYRGMNREYRQIACRNIYHFECKCVICSDPTKEVDMLDSYLCPKCKGLIPEVQKSTTSYCVNCGEKIGLKIFRRINDQAQKYLESEDVNQLEVLVKCLKIREKILYKHHKDFEEVYYRLYSYYVENCDAENMFKYFHLWLTNEKARRGENSRGIGTKLYEAALAILHCLQNGHPKNCNLKDFLQNVECMIKEAKIVLNLYYPAYITNRLSAKIQYISHK